MAQLHNRLAAYLWRVRGIAALDIVSAHYARGSNASGFASGAPRPNLLRNVPACCGREGRHARVHASPRCVLFALHQLRMHASGFASRALPADFGIRSVNLSWSNLACLGGAMSFSRLQCADLLVASHHRIMPRSNLSFRKGLPPSLVVPMSLT